MEASNENFHTALLTEERIERIRSVVAKRQHDLTLILENVHDPHNLGAVLRTCDSVGIREIYVIYTDPQLQGRGVQAGHKSSSGSRKWVKVHYFKDLEKAIHLVKSKYGRIIGTLITPESADLYEIDWTGPVALAFGNEHDGISNALQKHLDGNFLIPQVGFVQSLNISVACAVSLYEVFRQRKSSAMYNRDFGTDPQDKALYADYVRTHNTSRTKGRM